MDGIVYNIQRMSTKDGPGLRTTVFLKGCPLHCPWCSNPESQSFKPQLMFFSNLCVGCGICERVCPNGAVVKIGDVYNRDRSVCTDCGLCVESCPSKAREMSGKRMTVEEVMRVVDSDSLFYDNSGGGVTFGGGEPTAAGAFLLGLLDASIRRGYHICLDTCGVCEPERFRKIMNQVELFLFDCKHMDPDEHKRLTGLDNVLILQNLHTLFEAKKALHIRVPLMPGINDTEKNIAQMAAFLHKHGHNDGLDKLEWSDSLKEIQRNWIGRSEGAQIFFGHSKYAALNLADPVMVPYQPEELAAALERFAKYDLKVTIV